MQAFGFFVVFMLLLSAGVFEVSQLSAAHAKLSQAARRALSGSLAQMTAYVVDQTNAAIANGTAVGGPFTVTYGRIIAPCAPGDTGALCADSVIASATLQGSTAAQGSGSAEALPNYNAYQFNNASIEGRVSYRLD